MSDIILEAWESKTVLDNNDFEKTKSGDLVFKVIFDGINEKDAHKIAWGWSKITHLIHENIPNDKWLHEYQDHELGDPYNRNLSNAKEWINNPGQSTPISFASGTESQRIYLKKRKNDLHLSVPIYDVRHYEVNEKYYSSLLGLLGINLNEAREKGEDVSRELENVNVEVIFDNKKMSRIEIRERNE